MATLYVENIPGDRYEALFELANRHGRSIAAEVLAPLEEPVPTGKEIEAGREAIRGLDKLRFTSSSTTPVPSALDMIREDRDR